MNYLHNKFNIDVTNIKNSDVDDIRSESKNTAAKEFLQLLNKCA